MAKTDAVLEGESQTALIYSLCIVLTTLSSVSVGLRLYARTMVLKSIGPDDVAIAIAQVLAIGLSITTILEAVWGLGRHQKFVSQESLLKQMQCLYTAVLLYNLAQHIVKASFLIQYRRLFRGGKTHKICFWLLVFIVAWAITVALILGLACIPLAIIVPSMASKCLPTLPLWHLTGAMNIATDVTIFVVPIPSVLKLQLGSRQKLLLCGIFCLGFFTCLISLVRLTTVHKAAKSSDPTWNGAPAAYWSVVELNCGILCACLPTLRTLILRTVPKFMISRSATHTVSHQHTSLQKKSRIDAKDAIYIQQEVELTSTTALSPGPYERSCQINEHSREQGGGHPPSLEQESGHSHSLEQESQQEDFHAVVQTNCYSKR